MDSFYTMLRLQTMLLIFMLVGVYIKKRKIVTAEAQPYFTEFLVRIALPCMIFHSFRPDGGVDMLLSAANALWISCFVCLWSFVLGAVLYRKSPPSRRSVMRYGTLVSNAGFAGLPQVKGAFGETGLLYASIYLIPLRIFMWSGGISLFLHTDIRTKAKKVLTNPGMLAVFLGLPRMLFQIPLPAAVDAAIASIGDCTNPLSMIVIGMVVADIPWKTVLNRDVLFLSFIRLILIPASVLCVLKLVHVDTTLLGVAVILSAMPIGVNTPILAQKHNADHEFASKAVLLSTIISLITLPVFSLFI